MFKLETSVLKRSYKKCGFFFLVVIPVFFFFFLYIQRILIDSST